MREKALSHEGSAFFSCQQSAALLVDTAVGTTMWGV